MRRNDKVYKHLILVLIVDTSDNLSFNWGTKVTFFKETNNESELTGG